MDMDTFNYKRTKRICYYTNLAMSSVFSLPPLLFATFRELYGISYTLLGTLVLVNFCTQLGIDLIFSFFSKYFNIHKTIRLMPLVTAAGLCIYALIPTLFSTVCICRLGCRHGFVLCCRRTWRSSDKSYDCRTAVRNAG